jgi:hypothetical protein
MPDDELNDASYVDLIRSELAVIADRVRHPALSLVSFAADLPNLPDVDVDEDEDDAAEITDDDLSEEEREAARLRRAALLLAALQVIDRCIDDLQMIDFSDAGLLADEAEDSFVYEWFPPRHRAAYDEGFFRNVLVCAIRTADDLADPRGDHPTCTAEEIIRHAIGEIAREFCEAADLGQPWSDPDELLLEDTDFLCLYQEEMDGLENDPGMQAGLGLYVPPVSDWFAPFNPDRRVHPYAETAPAARRAHDLHLRLDEGIHPADLLESEMVDGAAPVGPFAGGSEVVTLARSVADTEDAGLWVADDADRERSFAALVALASTVEAGSGWLEWEPYEGADTVRTDPVVLLIPHRHFPVGDDEPWVSASVGGSIILAVPLRVVVAYRPDPDVRRRWNKAFEF